MHASISVSGTLNSYISGLPFTVLANTIRQTISVTEANGGNLSPQTVLSVVNESSYIKVGTIGGGNQLWSTTSNLWIGGSGCYIKA